MRHVPDHHPDSLTAGGSEIRHPIAVQVPRGDLGASTRRGDRGSGVERAVADSRCAVPDEDRNRRIQPVPGGDVEDAVPIEISDSHSPAARGCIRPGCAERSISHSAQTIAEQNTDSSPRCDDEILDPVLVQIRDDDAAILRPRRVRNRRRERAESDRADSLAAQDLNRGGADIGDGEIENSILVEITGRDSARARTRGELQLGSEVTTPDSPQDRHGVVEVVGHRDVEDPVLVEVSLHDRDREHAGVVLVLIQEQRTAIALGNRRLGNQIQGGASEQKGGCAHEMAGHVGISAGAPGPRASETCVADEG